MLNFGGNLIGKIEPQISGQQVIATSPYFFYYHKLSEGADAFLTSSSQVVYMITPGTIVVQKKSFAVAAGDTIFLNNQNNASMASMNQCTQFVICGSDASQSHSPKFEIVSEHKSKKVVKPWGYELWMSGENSPFALKKIVIKSGTKTSLQYHQEKRETNLIWGGEAKLHYKSTQTPNDLVTASDISCTQLSMGHFIDICPNNIHRIEAVSDLVLLEASTPHLDDVIRIADDSSRPSGRIQAEHKVL